MEFSTPRGEMFILLGGKPIRIRESAKMLNVNPSYLSRLLNGKRSIHSVRVGLVQQMTELFGFDSIEEFLTAVKTRANAKQAERLASSVETPTGVAQSHLG